MPFTLAHPAAVMPLKRFCPRWFSFSALVVGSTAPDVGYAFGPLGVDELSHTFVGTILFCVPAGVLMMAAFYALRTRLISLLPKSHREPLLNACQPAPPPFTLILSLLIGAWTHLLWDSFTHRHGYFVMRLPFLQTHIAEVAGRQILLCHVLWYFSSFFGVALLYLAYEKWRRRMDTRNAPISAASLLRNAFIVGLIVLPIETLHHLIYNPMLFAVVGIAAIAVVIGVAFAFGNPLRRTGN